MGIDALSKQMLELSDKVDALHGLIEQLTDKVSRFTGEKMTGEPANAVRDRKAMAQGLPEQSLRHGHFLAEEELIPSRTTSRSAHGSTPRIADLTPSHKDILSDELSWEGDKSGKAQNLSPEVQIQRLTAQLTAAYNRMAVLEEQILDCRFH